MLILEVQIILPRPPALRTCARRAIWVLWHIALSCLEGELSLELCLERGYCGDKFRTGLFKNSLRCHGPIRLDFQQEIGMQWMRHFVSGKEHLRHRKNLCANHVTQRVVLLHDLESGCIGDFGVFCDFDGFLAVFEDKKFKSVWLPTIL